MWAAADTAEPDASSCAFSHSLDPLPTLAASNWPSRSSRSTQLRSGQFRLMRRDCEANQRLAKIATVCRADATGLPSGLQMTVVCAE